MLQDHWFNRLRYLFHLKCAAESGGQPLGWQEWRVFCREYTVIQMLTGYWKFRPAWYIDGLKCLLDLLLARPDHRMR